MLCLPLGRLTRLHILVPPHQIVNLDHLQENVVLPSRNPILPHLFSFVTSKPFVVRLLSCCSRTWGSRELDFFALDGLVMLLGDTWRLGGWLLNCELCWNWKMNDAHGSRSTMLIPCISLHLSLCVLCCHAIIWISMVQLIVWLRSNRSVSVASRVKGNIFLTHDSTYFGSWTKLKV